MDVKWFGNKYGLYIARKEMFLSIRILRLKRETHLVWYQVEAYYFIYEKLYFQRLLTMVQAVTPSSKFLKKIDFFKKLIFMWSFESFDEAL